MASAGRRQIFGGGTSITKSRRWRPQINGGGSAGARLYLKGCYHRRRLWGQPGHAPPIIRMGGKTPFCPPPIIRREVFNFVYLKKINTKKSRNRDNNTKRTEYILNERCQFCKKVVEKKVVRNFGENRRELFQDFLSESKFAQNFCPSNICDPNFCSPNICVPNLCPPNIYDKSTPMDTHTYTHTPGLHG